MRLIDADELNKFPIRLDHYDKEHGNEHFVYGVEFLPMHTVSAPCHGYGVHGRQILSDDMRRDGMCEALLNFHGAERYMTNEDFFCAHGERKTDE